MGPEQQRAGEASGSSGSAEATGSFVELSIIVPLYNEEDSVGPLYERIVEAVDPVGIS